MRRHFIIKADSYVLTYSPYQGKKYLIDTGSSMYSRENDPKRAILKWFIGSEKHPMDCAIRAKTREDGIELLEVAQRIVPKLYEQYDNPYKLEWLEEVIQKTLNNNLKYFYEQDDYGDQIEPFTYG